jgi:crossover junction endodeoxyribonuclease RuvC
MLIVALDLATATGWCSGQSDGEPRYGTLTLPSTGSDIGRFALAFHEWLDAFLAVERPDTVVFEAPILTGGKTSIDTARKLLGLAYHTELICAMRSIRVREANLMTVKKNFAGHGRADKDTMQHVARKYGWRPTDEHQADALAVWASAVQTMAPKDAGRFAMGPLGAKPR